MNDPTAEFSPELDHPATEPADVQPPEIQLAGFLSKFDPSIVAIAEAAAAHLRKQLPNFLELVYDNYNALAIGFGPTERASDVVFSLALYPRWVSLFFLQGKGLRDPAGILKGKGNKARHIVLTSATDLHDRRVFALMNEALARSGDARHPAVPYRMIIKSVSRKQRPRRPPAQEQPVSTADAKKSSSKPVAIKKTEAVAGGSTSRGESARRTAAARKVSVSKPVRKRKPADLDK